MAEITTLVLGDNAKGSPLTYEEMDQNLLNIQAELKDLQDNKEQLGESIVMSIALG